jgi:hypothetical protein
MNRAILANHVAHADLDRALRLWVEAQILRGRSDDHPVSDKISGAHLHRSFDHDMCLELALLTDHGASPDYGVRADFNIRAQLRRRIDDRSRMNFHRTPASLKLK